MAKTQRKRGDPADLHRLSPRSAWVEIGFGETNANRIEFRTWARMIFRSLRPTRSPARLSEQNALHLELRDALAGVAEPFAQHFVVVLAAVRRAGTRLARSIGEAIRRLDDRAHAARAIVELRDRTARRDALRLQRARRVLHL